MKFGQGSRFLKALATNVKVCSLVNYDPVLTNHVKNVPLNMYMFRKRCMVLELHASMNPESQTCFFALNYVGVQL